MPTVLPSQADQSTRTSDPSAEPWLVGPRPVLALPTDAEDAVLVAAHGGSGASTVAGLCPGLVEAAGWSADASVPVVVVCRSNAGGLVAAGRLLDAHREFPALGVLVVADAAGRLPVPLARRVRLLTGITVVWRVPWVEDWRRRGPSGPAPMGVTRVLDHVAALARTAAGR